MPNDNSLDEAPSIIANERVVSRITSSDDPQASKPMRERATVQNLGDAPATLVSLERREDRVTARRPAPPSVLDDMDMSIEPGSTGAVMRDRHHEPRKDQRSGPAKI